jgi:putative FmdB family regulatory protein
MPIYEYACQDCQHEFEALVRSSTVPECPQCHSTQLAKKLSVPAPAVTEGAAPPLPAGCGGCPAMGNPSACAMHHAA